MVPPEDFGFNEETAGDNAWQNRLTDTPAEIRAKAMQEFEDFTQVLRGHGVQVLCLSKTSDDLPPLPDAVFPNNWFSTSVDGTVVIYTAATPNRRAERRPLDLERLVLANGFDIRSYVYIGRIEESVRVLEGTGSMVFDHLHRVSYAARSDRTHPAAFREFVRLRGHTEGVLFDASDSRGQPIYHTNVMMSIGTHFAVVCSDCIAPTHRDYVVERLADTREVFAISMDQMEKGFCGNILELQSQDGEPLIAMSSRAYEAFGEDGRAFLSRFGTLVHSDLATIEAVGGGSARCMLAEIFLPQARD